MKLINEDLNNEIVFEENKVNLLVVENKKSERESKKIQV